MAGLVDTRSHTLKKGTHIVETVLITVTYVFAQTPEWLDSDSCQKCEQPFFWNFKQMWDSKKIGLRQVQLTPAPYVIYVIPILKPHSHNLTSQFTCA